MTDNRTRLLQRIQRGRKVLPVWIAGLKGTCGVDVTEDDFLDIEETERLRSVFYNNVRAGGEMRRFVQKENFSQLLIEFKALARTTEAQILVVFHKADVFIGAVRLKGDAVFNDVESLWSVTEDDLSVATGDLSGGLCLEENFYDEAGNYFRNGIYELTTWGPLTLASGA